MCRHCLLQEWPQWEEEALVDHLHSRLQWHSVIGHVLIRELILSFVAERYTNSPACRHSSPEDVASKLQELIDMWESFKWFLLTPGLEYDPHMDKFYCNRAYWDRVYERGWETPLFQRFVENPPRYMRTLRIVCETYQVGKVDFTWLKVAVGETDPTNPWMGRPHTRTG